jgi:hypothetical protein
VQQIRVGWKRGTHAAREPGLTPSDGGSWLPDTPEGREDVAAMIRCGNDVCGKGTHWLEERTRVETADPSEQRGRLSRPPDDSASHA